MWRLKDSYGREKEKKKDSVSWVDKLVEIYKNV